MTFQVIYSSRAAQQFSMAELEAILVDAREGNRQRGITGALIFVEGVFVQILEGERDAVNALMACIAKDSRHTDLHIFFEAEIDQAMFSAWKMAYVSATPDLVATWLGMEGTASVQELLDDLHRRPYRASNVAEGILKAIAV